MKINKYFVALLLFGFLGNPFDQVQAGVFNKVALFTCTYLGLIGTLHLADNMKTDVYTVSHPITNYHKNTNKKTSPLAGQHFFNPLLQNDINRPIIYVQTSKLIDKGIFFDNRKERIDKVFEKAQSITPCLIISDNINDVAILESEQIMLQSYFLQKIQNLKESGHIIFLDERLIDAFNVSNDDKTEMYLLKNDYDLSDDDLNKYLENIFQHINFADHIDASMVYNLILEFYSGRHFSLVNYIKFIHNAQHVALKDNSDFIDLKHLYQALADQEKSYFQWILNLSKFVYGDNVSTMYHEAGHALLAMKKNTGRSVSYVTVLPRSFYGGKVSMQEHYKDITQNDLQLEHDIMMYLAGGVCEQIFGFPKKTTWDDMDAGFLDLLGRHGIAIDLDLAQERARLLIKDKDTLDEIIINQQVELILKDCYIKTFNYISENKSDIICIVDLLRKKGIISSKELQTLLDNNE